MKLYKYCFPLLYAVDLQDCLGMTCLKSTMEQKPKKPTSISTSFCDWTEEFVVGTKLLEGGCIT